MALTETVCGGGLPAVQKVHLQERVRWWAAIQRVRKLRVDPAVSQEDFEKAVDETEHAAPLWQQICGFGPGEELAMDIGARRAGIRRLMRTVETLFRAEMNSEDQDADGAPSKLESGETSYAGRSALWDPLNEICVYLQISKAKLNALSVQRTGLRAGEVCDCIRAEKLRAHLREKFRPLARMWRDGLDESARELIDNVTNLAWKFLKWVRGAGQGGTRKRLALELGLTSREKLDRAAFHVEGEALDEVEVRAAARALNELLEAELAASPPRDIPDFLAHRAECDEVGEEGNEEGGCPEDDAAEGGGVAG